MDTHRLLFYTLDEYKMPVRCDARWSGPFGTNLQTSMSLRIGSAGDGLDGVLELDFGFGLWETMVLGGRMDRYQARSDGQLAEALKMHERILELVKLAEELAPCLGFYDSLDKTEHASQPTAPVRKSLGALRAKLLVLNCVHKIHQFIPRCFNRPVRSHSLSAH